ncbi:copia protein [Tanacetum coccineum]
MKVEESLNVTFDEIPPPTKLSPLVDDDVGEEEAIKRNTKVLNYNKEDESIEVDEIVNIKDSKTHPQDQVIGNLNQRTLRSQAQNHTNDVWELVPLPISQSVIGTKWVFRNKLDENGIVSRNKARLVAQEYNQQEDIDYDEIYAPVARLESIRILLAIDCANDLKLYQMDVKGTRVETIVYADSDQAGDYVYRKSTSGICTFMGCCLTSWFAKKQTTLSISTTEAEYVSARKASQQALWMKQALIDYSIRLDDVLIMCDNKGIIDLSKNPVQHSRTKHIEILHHFLRDNVQKGNISIEKVASEDNIADIFTKPLKREVFNYLGLGLEMMELIMDSDSPSSQK